MAQESRTGYIKRISGQSAELRTFWSPRNKKFKEWYDVLSLVDENRTTGLESFTSNDPRTLYNMALFLLCPDEVTHNIPIRNANETEQGTITLLEGFVTSRWRELDKASFKSGMQSWLRHLTGLLLATGWYSVFALKSGDNFIADIWNPSEVYPWFDDGLAEVSRMYQVSSSTVRRWKANNNWDIRFNDRTSAPVNVIDYWCYGNDGLPENTVIIGDELAKRRSYPELACIPVYISPVGGLPDIGKVEGNNNTWKEHIGESILAPNIDVMRNYNRLLSFLLQTARDTAQPPIIEKSQGDGVVNEKDIGKRGIVYKVDREDSIETLAMGGIPPEIPLQLQNMRTMLQRGGFADGLFTGVDGSGYLQSLVSASSQQVLKPYNQALNHLFTDIDNGWLHQLRNSPESLPFDITTLPEHAEFMIDIKVSVPGDLIQRATTARQLAPDIKFSQTTVMDLLFPEIRDPNGELVLSRKDRALGSDIMASLDLVAALNDQADALDAEGNKRQADLYRNYAKQAEQQLTAPQQSTPQGVPGQANAGMM